MKHWGWILLAVLSLYTANAAASPTKLIGTGNCFSGNFATYDGWLAFFTKRNPDASPEELERFTGMLKKKFPESLFNKYKSTLTCQSIRYEHDGVPVIGYFVAPKGAKNLPTIVYNRGGNGNYGAMVFTQMFNELFDLASEGFAIIGTQYRGVGIPDSEYQDEFGGADVNDVLALRDLFDEFEAIDSNRVGLMGFSRGGMQSMLALKHGFETNAAVLVAGDYDLKKSLELRPEMERVYAGRIPGYADNKKEQLEARSALFWLDELDQETAFLLITGNADERVNYKQSMRLNSALKAQGFNSELIIFDGGKHALGPFRTQLVQQTKRFFLEHL